MKKYLIFLVVLLKLISETKGDDPLQKSDVVTSTALDISKVMLDFQQKNLDIPQDFFEEMSSSHKLERKKKPSRRKLKRRNCKTRKCRERRRRYCRGRGKGRSTCGRRPSRRKPRRRKPSRRKPRRRKPSRRIGRRKTSRRKPRRRKPSRRKPRRRKPSRRKPRGAKDSKPKAQCKAAISYGDIGYADNYRGYYDVQGCGKCYDYCRWVGNGGPGGDPAKKTIVGNKWWSCALAGSKHVYSSTTHFKNGFLYKKCSGKGANAP